jgi:hypothetical protein
LAITILIGVGDIEIMEISGDPFMNFEVDRVFNSGGGIDEILLPTPARRTPEVERPSKGSRLRNPLVESISHPTGSDRRRIRYRIPRPVPRTGKDGGYRYLLPPPDPIRNVLMEGEIGIVDMGLYDVMPPHAFQTLTFLVVKALRVSTIN